ncbi:MAG: RagB/SusD family nutrient uptake outer membrane protein [Dysgonamonadaceae bacterium]|jgi:hypothetical protein|nr:RagB/SusD family nutrient uptake outer membrane protein [Dysgonamonadaceae bacterium]
MKSIKKIFTFMACALLMLACDDLNTVPEGGSVTTDQDKAIGEAIPSRVSAKLSGMYNIIAQQYCVYGSATGRHDDFGYPAITLSQDLNGPDMTCVDDGYNWFTVSSDYTDRSETFANPYMRYGVFYKQIQMANSIIASIDPETDNPTLKAYLAQAKATLAFDYLSLVPYYQFKYKGHEDELSVPLIGGDGDPANNPRKTVREVYKYIMDNINEAIEGLKDYKRTSKAEIDQNVAYGIRARANLYMENWEDAAADAEKALAGYTPASREEISKPAFIDIKDHNWMWGLIIGPEKITAAYPSWPAKLSSFSGDSYTAAVGCYKRINKILFDLIPASDARKGWWVDDKLKTANLESVTWDGKSGNDIPPLVIDGVKVAFLPYTNVKFGQYGGPGSTVNAGDWCLMRVEEMILIQAEALAMSGKDGKTVLESFVKTYRDPSYTCPASSGESFQNEVWKQRRIELWGEGFAMSDIMRLGKNMVRVVAGKESNIPLNFQFNLAADDEWLLLRFPQQETNSNPAVKQNSGGTEPKEGDGANLRDGITN